MSVVVLPSVDAPADGAELGLEDLPAVMSPKVLAELLEVSVKTLERWRDGGSGPAFMRLPGSSLIRYSRVDVAAWLTAARVDAEAGR